ncbi:MAG: hypothetical protein ACHBN1_04795 [Heteroscytonema crispum UTEX LB 1556]
MSDFQSSDLGLLSRECISLHLYGSQIELILAGLALLQQNTQKEEHQPFSSTEIESLHREINDSIAAYMRSPVFHWKQTVAQMPQTDANSPLRKLINHLDYAVEKDNISPEQALEVLAGERSYLLDIDRQQLREEALAAFDEYFSTKETYQLNFQGSRYDFCLTYTQTWFEITATLRHSNKRSTINTLNYILSAFDIDPDSSNAENPEWSGTPQQVQAWVQTAERLFGNKLFLEGLEQALDQDRQQGEWEVD